MASVIYNRDSKTRTIQFTDSSGRRPKIQLGKVSKQHARGVCVHIEHLLYAKNSGQAPPTQTATWVAELSTSNTKLAKRLARLGLIQLATHQPDERQCQNITLADFLDSYIETFGPNRKPTTVTTWKQARRLAIEFFGNRLLTSISEGDALEFREYLASRATLEFPANPNSRKVRYGVDADACSKWCNKPCDVIS